MLLRVLLSLRHRCGVIFSLNLNSRLIFLTQAAVDDGVAAAAATAEAERKKKELEAKLHEGERKRKEEEQRKRREAEEEARRQEEGTVQLPSMCYLFFLLQY